MNKTKFFRNCPNCNKKIYYINKQTKSIYEIKKSKCRSCCQLGKKYSQEVNNKKASKGSKNGMFGKSVYSVWLQKYGKEIADKKLFKFKNECSKRNKGKNNPMFGKPSPNGSGNGWQGWYKNFKFDSLKELKFLIYLNKFNFLKFLKKGPTIKYKDHNKNIRNYFSDFLFNETTIIEIKPKHLFDSINVLNKKKGALKYCKQNNLKYKLIDSGRIRLQQILKERKNIKFIDRYENKFKEYYEKNKNNSTKII